MHANFYSVDVCSKIKISFQFSRSAVYIHCIANGMLTFKPVCDWPRTVATKLEAIIFEFCSVIICLHWKPVLAWQDPCTTQALWRHGLPKLEQKNSSGLHRAQSFNPNEHLWDELKCWLRPRSPSTQSRCLTSLMLLRLKEHKLLRWILLPHFRPLEWAAGLFLKCNIYFFMFLNC